MTAIPAQDTRGRGAQPLLAGHLRSLRPSTRPTFSKSPRPSRKKSQAPKGTGLEVMELHGSVGGSMC